MSIGTQATPAGWHTDPGDGSALRWWDGSQWTAHTRPRPSAPQPSPASPAPAVTTAAAPAVSAAPQTVARTGASTDAQPAPWRPTLPTPPQPVIPGSGVPGSTGAPSAPWQPGMPVWQPAAAAPAASPFASPEPAVPSLAAAAGFAVPQPVSAPAWPDEPAIPARAGATGRARSNGLGSAQTVGGWLLALSPVLLPLVAVGVQLALDPLGLPEGAPLLAGIGVALVIAWVLAGADIAQLRRNSYLPPSIAWMLLLPPLAYLVARGRKVRRDEGLAWPLELVFLLLVLAAVAAEIAQLWPAFRAVLPDDLADALPF